MPGVAEMPEYDTCKATTGRGTSMLRDCMGEGDVAPRLPTTL